MSLDTIALIAGLTQRLRAEPPALPPEDLLVPDWQPEVPFDRPPVPAAVLIALVERPEGLTVLYTERSPNLRSHSGQVAFPGGKVDAGDRDVAAAALREAWEEVSLDQADAQVLGFMDTYFTGTNYLITPVVARVAPRRPFVPNPGEVHSVFEVPLERILDMGSYGQLEATRRGQRVTSWHIDHDGHRIWGITANLTRRLRELLIAVAA